MTRVEAAALRANPRAVLEPIGRRKLAAVAAHGTAEQVEAICEVAKQRAGKTRFTNEEWDALLAEIDASPLSVRDWLALEVPS